MNHNSIEALLRKRQNDFIEKRTIIESEVDKFLQSLESLDDSDKVQIEYKPNQTARTMLPELWHEPFDETTYNIQLAELQKYIARVAMVFDEINREALRCLQE